MITLNNLISKLADFTAAHKILNSWYFNSPYEKLPDGKSITYPMMFGVLKPAKLGEHTDRTIITIYISDRVKKDKSNELEVSSDMKLIAKDVLSYMKQTRFGEPLIIGQDITLEHYYESFDDEVTGVMFDVEFKTAFDWLVCTIPIT